jgi:hypothetical protein
MLQALVYLVIILTLVYWVEQPQFFSIKPLIIRRHPAQELEDWLKRFHWGNRAELGGKLELPRYKFYTGIVELLLNMARKLGGNYQESLLFLRAGLQADRQFEKKLKEMVLGCWLQMGLMMLLTWAFILGALTMVEVKVGLLPLMLILLWQCTGLVTLPFFLRHFRRRLFGDIGKLWHMLYVLNSLSRVPLARGEILKLAGVVSLKDIRQKNLDHLVVKLKAICQRALQVGGSYEEEVLSLMEELRFQEKWHFELFEKRLLVLKLALLSVFFLPSYLAFIFLLLGDLLALL